MDQIVKEHLSSTNLKLMIGKGNGRELIIKLLTAKI